MKLDMKKNYSNQKGITLIALVVTIVVLLILTVVGIYALLGDNGIIDKAKESKDKTLQSSSEEKKDIKNASDKLGAILEKNRKDIILSTYELKTELKNSKSKVETLTANLKNVVGNLEWASSDSTVAEISGTGNTRNIILKKAGTANITVSCGKISKTCIVSVTNREAITAGNSAISVGDYVNFPVYYDNVKTFFSNGVGYTPNNTYQGWRILSIEEKDGNAYVRIISDGIPLTFYRTNNYKIYSSTTTDAVENLTTKFFDTDISSSCVHNKFNLCGFKTSKNGNKINSIVELKKLFENAFTQKYGNEGASYTDSTLNMTFNNTSAKDYPKVMSVTKEDIEKLTKSKIKNNGSLENLDHSDMINIIATSTAFEAWYWFGSAGGTTSLWLNSGKQLTLEGNMGSGSARCFGVRPVVDLNTDVEFLKAPSMINNTTIWNISI